LKDVPGYFDADPNLHADAGHLETLGYDDAIGMAEEGCDLVQLRALEAARDLNVRLLVRAMDHGLTTVVGKSVAGSW
jgi:aspartokinase